MSIKLRLGPENYDTGFFNFCFEAKSHQDIYVQKGCLTKVMSSLQGALVKQLISSSFAFQSYTMTLKEKRRQ